MLLCRAEQIDVLVDLTGSVEFGAHVVLEAARNGKHSVLMNAELDATIGPILGVHVRRHGVIMSACDGDEPGLQMNLVRWVRGLGLEPRVIGNVKGLQDPYRNPDTQAAFAEKWGQNPAMVTSFADGSKISFEQTIVANATGAKVLGRGMSRGVKFDGKPLELPSIYDVDEVRELGCVIDYTVGPADVKVFVLAEHDDPKQRHYLSLYKMGDGPLHEITDEGWESTFRLNLTSLFYSNRAAVRQFRAQGDGGAPAGAPRGPGHQRDFSCQRFGHGCVPRHPAARSAR